MKRYHFTYSMEHRYSAEVSANAFTLKCIPPTDDLQEIQMETRRIAPADWISEGTDSFGNGYLYGYRGEPHRCFSVEISGTASVFREERRKYAKEIPLYYRGATARTACSAAMRDFARPVRERYWDAGKCTDVPGAAWELSRRIYDYMEYVPGATDVSTGADEAFALGKGVCQDYAHILLAVCRDLGISCAYVAGFLKGEGLTHAWTAVWDGATGLWHEIDPTNNRLGNDEYIHVAKGCDAEDCMVNKGIFRGFAAETQEVHVSVRDLDGRE